MLIRVDIRWITPYLRWLVGSVARLNTHLFTLRDDLASPMDFNCGPWWPCFGRCQMIQDASDKGAQFAPGDFWKWKAKGFNRQMWSNSLSIWSQVFTFDQFWGFYRLNQNIDLYTMIISCFFHVRTRCKPLVGFQRCPSTRFFEKNGGETMPMVGVVRVPRCKKFLRCTYTIIGSYFFLATWIGDIVHYHRFCSFWLFKTCLNQCITLYYTYNYHLSLMHACHFFDTKGAGHIYVPPTPGKKITLKPDRWPLF